MLGLSHRSAAVELREKLAQTPQSAHDLLAALKQRFPRCEAALLDTCNRVELYLARPVHEPPSVEDLRDFLAQASGVGSQELATALVHREQEQAIVQLFRVCAGLDSMVLGETQILGQVKRAYERSRAAGTVGPVLHTVMQEALATGKSVRTQTGIDAGRLSVGSAAVEFARRVFERFDDKTVLAIGAGEMAKVTLRHLMPLRPRRLFLTNRTESRAAALAQLLQLDPQRGGVRPYEALDALLLEADAVISSTGSADPILTAKRMTPIVQRRRGRPLVLIDIALPRDVEPAVASLRNVFLYNLDDLQSLVQTTLGSRKAEVEQAEQLVRRAAGECLSHLQHRDVGQLVRALRSKLTAIGEQERQRTLRKLAAADHAQAPAILEEHTHRLINKILHLPLTALDHRRAEVPLGFYAAALRKLFELDLDEEPASSEPQTPTSPSTVPPAPA